MLSPFCILIVHGFEWPPNNQISYLRISAVAMSSEMPSIASVGVCQCEVYATSTNVCLWLLVLVQFGVILYLLCKQWSVKSHMKSSPVPTENRCYAEGVNGGNIRVHAAVPPAVVYISAKARGDRSFHTCAQCPALRHVAHFAVPMCKRCTK